MIEEKENKCQALVGYEPKPLNIRERLEAFAERKRGELDSAIREGKVRDPVSLLITVGISIVASLASSAIARAFAPKLQPLTKGGMGGQRLIISSQLGVMIPEFYFGMLDDGVGGTWLPAIVISLSPLAKQTNVSRQDVGGGKGGGHQTQEVQEIVYYFPYLALMYGRGPGRALKLKANADTIFDLYGQVSTYEGENPTNTFSGSYQIQSNDATSGGGEVVLHSGAAVQFNSVLSNGAAIRGVTVRFLNSDPTPMELYVNGVLVQSVTLPDANNNWLSRTFSVTLNDGNNTIKIKNTSPSLFLRIDFIYCFPGHTTGTTGVLNPTITPDDSYDPATGFDPTLPYTKALERFDSVGEVDEFGVQTGTILHGGNAQFAIYPGNQLQLPDPTMQSAIDALYGPDSTPAYRGRTIEVDTNLYLTRWSNAIPNRKGLFEHETIKTLAQFCGYECGRVNTPSSDYDFSAFEGITPRGLRKLQRYEAKEPMMEAATIFNLLYTEEDFKIVGKLRGSASVATLTDEDFAWVEGEDLPEQLGTVDVTEPNPTTLPARVEVKHLEMDREGDPGLQGYGRHETIGVETETLDFSDWTLISDEAQALAQRIEYQRYVEKPVRFTLSWKYLWFTAGMQFTAALSNGFTCEIEITKIAGGIGIQECEGILVDTPVFTQPVSVDDNLFGVPVVPIPAMSILALLDIPGSDKDASINSGVVIHAAVTPRTNSGQVWTGASLFLSKVGWERKADFILPATIGVISSLNIVGTNTSTFDRDSWIEFDLYHTDQFTPTLESVSEADVLNGANLLAISTPDGDILTQFANAEQVSSNRWRVSTLLHGRRGTEGLVSSYETGRRVVFINQAVQAIPMNLSDLNAPLDWCAVSNGASLDDSAVIEDYVWTGRPRQPLSIVNPVGTRDSEGDLLIEFLGRTRVGGGLRSNQGGAVNEEEEIYKIQILDGSGNPVAREPLTVVVGMAQAAALNTYSSGGDKFDHIDQHTLTVAGTDISIDARTIQEILATGNYVEATLMAGGEGAATLSLLDKGTLQNRFSIFVNGGLVAGIYVQIGNDPYISVGSYSPGTSLRFRISLSSTEVRFYLNYNDSSTPPLYVSPVAPIFPLVPACSAATGSSGGGGGTAHVEKMFLTTRPFPKTIYSHSQQEEDFGSVQSSIQMDIWQHGLVTGDGEKVRVIL